MKSARKFLRFKAEEVSFVSKGANRKKRYLIKNEEDTVKDVETLVERITKAEVNEEQVASVKKSLGEYSEEMDTALAAASTALALLESVKDKLPAGFSLSMGENGVYASVYSQKESVPVIKEEGGEATQSTDTPDQGGSGVADSTQTAGDETTPPEATQGESTVEVEKSEKLPETVVERVRKAEEEVKVLKAELAKKEEQELTTLFVSKAEKEFSCLGVPDEVGEVLKKVHKALAPTDFEKVIGVLKFAQGQLETGAQINREIGTATVPVTKAEKLAKLAKDYMKDNPKATIEQARVAVRKAHPELND